MRHLKLTILLAIVCSMAGSVQAQGKVFLRVTYKGTHASWGGANPVNIELDDGPVSITIPVENPSDNLAALGKIFADRKNQREHGTARLRQVSRDHSKANTQHNSDTRVSGTVQHQHSGTVRNGQCGFMNSCAGGCGERWPVTYNNGSYSYTCPRFGLISSTDARFNYGLWNYRYNYRYSGFRYYR